MVNCKFTFSVDPDFKSSKIRIDKMNNNAEADQWTTCGWTIFCPIKTQNYSIKAAATLKNDLVWERTLPTTGLFWSVSPAPCGWNLHFSWLVWMPEWRIYDLILLKLMDVPLNAQISKGMCVQQNRRLQETAGSGRKMKLNTELLNLSWHIYDRI